MKYLYIVLAVFIILFIESCNSLTKMRYSHGFKSNFEFSNKNREEKKTVIKANIAIKHHFNKTCKSADNEIIQNIELETIPTKLLPNCDNEFNTFKNKCSHPTLLLNHIALDSTKKTKTKKPPIEKNSTMAGILFFAGISTLVFGIGAIMIIAGVILAIISLRKIKRSKTPLRGKGTDKAILIIFFTILGLIALIIISFRDKK